ncbi:Uu.00g042120.m01.CDS01 [Anthostomella pinea]|uniref:Uu.00g042120.m01.CDS01 n=1 Tax=Anthostomella pinea TaxID=933095 RepID=A0AAI8YBP4_9PEZI|nr:Uu.00g042120.m01.CDS01 [Anthostomella pinea]
MAVSNRPPRNSFVTFARKIYNPIGFSKGYNFVLWFIFGGALVGFSLARLQYLDFYGVFCSSHPSGSSGAAPGECFYWLQTRYTVGIILHLACILPAALLAVVQFVPTVRYKAMMFHRINGYVVITLAIVSTGAAFSIAEISFGGGLDIRTAVGALGIAFIGALVMAYVNVKRLQIEQHRAWMIRAWVWAGCIITTRIIFIIAVSVPKATTLYYALPCDKLNWLLGDQSRTLSLYPECQSFFSGENPSQHASVRQSFTNAHSVAEVTAAMNASFGMAIWLAWLIHIFGAELYLHLTPVEAERLRRVSYQRQLEAGMRQPGSAGLTADRLGDSEKWMPPAPIAIERKSSSSPSTS